MGRTRKRTPTGARTRPWNLAAASLAIVVLAVGATGAAPRGDERGPIPDHLFDLEHAADALRSASGAPGAILGLRYPDGRTEVTAVGTTSLEGTTPLPADVPFLLGSISKTYTAALVLDLADAGRLSLDDRLDRWVPEYPLAPTVTLRQLLHQTTGFKDFYMWVYVRPWDEMLSLLHRDDWTVEQMLALASRFGEEGWFDPGMDWDYSSTNAFLLGLAAERAGGAPYAELLRGYVLAPLGLGHTWLDGWEPARGELVMRGTLGEVGWWEHSSRFGDLGDATILDGGNLEWAAGGLAATAEDALRFFDQLLSGSFLSEPLQAELTTWVPSRPLGSPDAPGDWSYGAGLARRHLGGRTLIGHGGMYNGYTAGLWHLEECNLTLVFGINRGLVPMQQTVDPVLDLVVCSEPDS